MPGASCVEEREENSKVCLSTFFPSRQRRCVRLLEPAEQYQGVAHTAFGKRERLKQFSSPNPLCGVQRKLYPYGGGPAAAIPQRAPVKRLGCEGNGADGALL